MGRVREAARLIIEETDDRLQKGITFQDRVAALYVVVGEVSDLIQAEMQRTRKGEREKGGRRGEPENC